MRMNHRRPACLLIALALEQLVEPATAADMASGAWMTDRFAIEVIVFRHLDQSRNTPEQPAVESIIPASPLELYLDADTAVPMGPYANSALSGTDADTRAPGPVVGFYLLDVEPRFPDFAPLDERQLARVYTRLESLDAYEPIAHFAWLQAARAADQSVPFQIAALDPSGEYRIEGTVTVYKERYVHIQVELGLSTVTPSVSPPIPEAATWPTYGDVFTPPDPKPVPLAVAAPPEFTLHESRRIRGTNAQYFDHPQFGVIARVTEVILDDDAADTGLISD